MEGLQDMMQVSTLHNGALQIHTRDKHELGRAKTWASQASITRIFA